MPVGSRPSPRRVKVRNTGGGDLNPRIASAPAWIQAELVGGTLTLKPDPKTSGSLLGDVVVDSEGGSAKIRVTAVVDPPNISHARGYYQGEKLATWWQRVVAAVIDLVAYIPGIIVLAAGGGNTPGGVLGVGIAVILVVPIYNRYYLQGRTGQSWGKRAMGLKLVHMSDKEAIGSLRAAVRDLCHAFDILSLYLWPIWDARRQTLADKAMHTVVISLKA